MVFKYNPVYKSSYNQKTQEERDASSNKNKRVKVKTLKGAPDIGIIKHKQYFFKNLYVFAYHM